MTYQVGDKIRTRYTDAPIPPERRYQVGQLVDITDIDTNKVLAEFRVEDTDSEYVQGVIVRVSED